MQWFYNLNIGAKLIVSFVVASLITAFIGYEGISNMGDINTMLKNLYQNETMGISYIKEANVNLSDFNIAESNFLSSSSQAERDKYFDEMSKVENDLKNNIEKATPLIHDEKEKELIKQFDGEWVRYKGIVDKIIATAKTEGFIDKHESIKMAKNEGRVQSDKIDTIMTEIASLKQSLGQEAYDNSEKIYAEGRIFMILVILGAVGLGLGLGIFISRIISRPVIKLTNAAEKLAIGDIDITLESSSKDEIGILTGSFKKMVENIKEQAFAANKLADGDLNTEIKVNSDKDVLGNSLSRMIERLKEVVENVKSATDNVSSGSLELSASSEELSQGATEQASAAEEVSSSMEQMTSNIKQNADNSRQTEKIALQSSKDAQEGGRSVSETVEAMKEIAGKISIIEEIARQTNLLALNAAIEAARAGEHGKGFAVVASEVRKLAERSQTAAAEINRLSATSIKVAEKAGEMIAQIVPSIQKTSELVQEISVSSDEQNSGADQINNALQQLNQVIQQNASSSEQMASTAEELASQAEQLQEVISFFKLKESDNGTVLKKIKASTVANKTNSGARQSVENKPGSYNKSVMNLKSVSGRKGNAGKNNGVSIDLGNNGDKIDDNFEKY